MIQKNDILEKAGGKTGYTVPENYFDNVRAKIMANLPEYPKQEAPKLTAWQRVRPYLYMAAMFAGIWCMMKVIHIMSTRDLSIENPPEAVAVAMADANHYDWMDVEKENSDFFELEEDLSSQYTSIEDFTKDFNSTQIES